MVALGEILFSRTLWTAPSRFQRTFGRAAKVLLWNWYRLWPLGHQLYHVRDAVKTTLPEVRQVTNIRTIWEAFNKTPVTETLLAEVPKLLRTSCIWYLYLWHRRLPFSSLRLLKTYLRSNMNQNRLNNCLLLHCHKSITDTLDTVDRAKKFVRANEQRKRHFGKYE